VKRLAASRTVLEKGTTYMNRRRRLPLAVIWLSTALLVSACGVLATPTPVREPLDLTIIHTGKVYGETTPCG
jgi:hypothetical protein